MSDTTTTGSKTPEAPRGWLCPACGGGVAPGVERCPCVAIARAVSVPFVQPTDGTASPPPYKITTWPPVRPTVTWQPTHVIDYGQYSTDGLPVWSDRP